MITIRRDAEIFDISRDWFRARWHFSFDQYRDPENDGLDRSAPSPSDRSSG